LGRLNNAKHNLDSQYSSYKIFNRLKYIFSRNYKFHHEHSHLSNRVRIIL